MTEGLSKTGKKVTIDEGQNTVQSNGGTVGSGFLKPTTLDLDIEKNVLSGRFSVSPVTPAALDTEGPAQKRVVVIQPISNGRFTIIPQEPQRTGLPLREFIGVFWRTWVVVLGPFLLSPIVLCSPEDPQTLEALKCAYLILLMAVYWMTEALPLPITSMIPMVGLPLLGLMSTGEVAVNYLNSTNYMFLGGLIMAIAVEHCGLHNRVALKIIMMVGTSQARLMLGFMFTTMFLSMWISNTATTAMMLPIVDAVAEAINQKEPINSERKGQVPESEQKDTETNDSLHESEQEDEFNEDDYDLPFNQRTFTSINQLSLNQRTLNSLNHMTINSFNSLNPANDPESMVAFLPNVRRNTLERVPSTDDPRSRFHRRNTMERIQRQDSRLSRQESIDQTSIVSKDDLKKLENQIPIEVEIDPSENQKEETERNFLLLAVAYAANIGGTGVITGSPPNLVVPDVLISSFGQNTGLTFASWMAFAIPVMLVNTILAWLWLQLLQSRYPGGKAKKGKEQEERAMKVITEKYSSLGSMNLHEAQVLVLFIILIGLWFFKTPIFMPGWGDAFNVEKTVRGSSVSVGSATPAIFMSILLFILPQTYNFWPFASMSHSLQNAPSLITWRLIETKMCWGVIFLLGGGFALAKASQNSGLSTLLVVQLNKINLESLPLWLTSFIICFVTVTITNVASNTATANVLVPILAKMAVTMCINPIYLTLPAGVVCSYAFALPVATAPNAIVFGHSTMKTTDMMKAGFVMNLICVITLCISINSYAVPLFGLNNFPDWAAVKHPNATLCLA